MLTYPFTAAVCVRYLLKCLALSSSVEATERAQQSCCRFQKAVEQVRTCMFMDPEGLSIYVLRLKGDIHTVSILLQPVVPDCAQNMMMADLEQMLIMVT